MWIHDKTRIIDSFEQKKQGCVKFYEIVKLYAAKL